jgi:hypothetical protein
MKPTIGRIVHYYQGDREAAAASCNMGLWTVDAQDEFVRDHGATCRVTNGQRFHPALIIHVFSDACVNLMVFFGDGTMELRLSSSLMPDELFQEGAHCQTSGWRWPLSAGR